MKLSEKKKSVAGKMTSQTIAHNMRASHKYSEKCCGAAARSQGGKSSLSPVKHKVDVAGQESYKEEDK